MNDANALIEKIRELRMKFREAKATQVAAMLACEIADKELRVRAAQLDQAELDLLVFTGKGQ